MDVFVSLSSPVGCDAFDTFDLDTLYASLDKSRQYTITEAQLIRGSIGSAQYAVRLNSELDSSKDKQFVGVVEITSLSIVSVKYSMRLFNVSPVASGAENKPGLLDGVAASVPKKEPIVLGDLQPKFIDSVLKKAKRVLSGDIAFVRFLGYDGPRARYYVCYADPKRRTVVLYDVVLSPIGANRAAIIAFKPITDPKFKFTSVGVVRRAVDAALSTEEASLSVE